MLYLAIYRQLQRVEHLIWGDYMICDMRVTSDRKWCALLSVQYSSFIEIMTEITPE